jgi:hypothetical protein
MADDEVLFDDVYELCEIIGKWVSISIHMKTLMSVQSGIELLLLANRQAAASFLPIHLR